MNRRDSKITFLGYSAISESHLSGTPAEVVRQLVDVYSQIIIDAFVKVRAWLRVTALSTWIELISFIIAGNAVVIQSQ
jgi:hypothetical protein